MKKIVTDAGKTNRWQGGLLIFAVLALSATGLFAATTNITNITQLDNLAAFSFAIMSDNKGFGTNGTASDNIICKRFVDWVSAKDKFCIGVGDHFTVSTTERLKFRGVMESNTFFHNNFYPNIGDHDNEVPFFYSGNGGPEEWGRGWVIYKFLNNFFDRPDVEFRPKQSSQVSSNGKMYNDQLIDYYARRSIGGMTVHMINVHFGDESVFAPRSRDFMINKLTGIAANKTDHDIVVVTAHSYNGEFFIDSLAKNYMNQSQVDFVMNNADLVCDATVHKFWRHRNYDSKYSGKGALWINTGTLDDSSTCLGGYVDIHVFNNTPPRFTMQWIAVEGKTSRALHVGAAKHSDGILDSETVPVVKEVNGRIYSVDWSKFELGSGTPPPQAFCHIDVPTGNVTVSPGASLLVKVSASDPDGVERVKLFSGATELMSDSSAPYELTLSNLTASFTLTAKVKDLLGNYTDSDNSRTITVSGGTTTTVPWVTNLTVAAAGTSITNAGLVVGSVSQEHHATVPAGKIFSQTPGGGTTVNRGTAVNLAESLGPSSATTVTFYSVGVHDGYVDESSETSNVGGTNSATLTTGTGLRVGDTGARKQRKTIVSFDTSTLPDAAVVTAATLKLKRGGGIGTPTSLGVLTVDIKNVSVGFGTSLNLENMDFEYAASKSDVGTLNYPATTNAWAIAALNTNGTARIAKTNHTQFRIRFATDDDNDSADDYLGFYSGENPTAANRPILEVTYQ